MIAVLSNDGTTEGRTIELKPKQGTVEIENLEPGTYLVQLMTPYERVPGQEGALTNKQLASTKIMLEEGQTQELEFGDE